jgi:hypothetical protein
LRQLCCRHFVTYCRLFGYYRLACLLAKYNQITNFPTHSVGYYISFLFCHNKSILIFNCLLLNYNDY